MRPRFRIVAISVVSLLVVVAAGASAALFSGWNGRDRARDRTDEFDTRETLSLRFPEGWADVQARPPSALLSMPKPPPPKPPPGPTRPLTRMAAAEFHASLGRIEARRRAQRNPNALFNDAQIASIKQRLQLTKAQEKHWPAMEAALRRLAWQDTNSMPPLLDAETAKPLKAAANRFIAVLNERQKRDIRMLANVGGLKLGL